MNTAYEASFSGQSIFLHNDYSEITSSSIDSCYGLGDQSSVLRYVCDVSMSSLNETNLICNYCPAFKGIKNINVSYCYIASNIAVRSEISFQTGSYEFFLTKSVYVNNTTPISLVSAEGGSKSIVSKCYFISNNSTMCFRSVVYDGKNASMIVEECSLIDNVYKYVYSTGVDCVVDISNIGTKTFYVFLSLKRLEKLPPFIDFKISCNAINIYSYIHIDCFLIFILI